MTTKGCRQKKVMEKNWIAMTEVAGDRLHIDRFTAAAGEVWCAYGNNSSGIDSFVDLFRRSEKAPAHKQLELPADSAVVSFKDQQELFELEVRNDDSDFLDRLDPGTPAREFLGNVEENRSLIEQFRLGHVLDSGYRQLSSGEGRKLLILKAVTDGARHLLIENPYDGLDRSSCTEFDRIMKLLIERGFAIIIVLSSRADIPGWCTHLAWIDNGKLVEQGARDQILERIENKVNGADWKIILETGNRTAGEGADELIRLVNGHARYGERTIFTGLDFSVKQGQHTLITGPNGAGKSTLLGLVTGDHPNCYTNELYLFGNRRGSGESIWQIKKEMGIVSPALHREHYVPGNCRQIVMSGFFDSIGLYSRCTIQQQELAGSWLSVIGLGDRQRTPFRSLSYGEQRLVLIARALIKMPQLLVLDEPTQGLDDANRANLLNFLELVVDKQISTIVYVSHRQDEYRSFFRQHIEFDRPA